MIHRVMYNCFVLGAILPSIEFLQNLGTSASSNEIWRFRNLASDDKRALEISFYINQSRSMWIFSVFYIFLGIGFVLYFVLTIKRKKGRMHGLLGVFCSILCVIAFGLAIGSFFEGKLLVAFGAINLLLAGISFPAWLIWLAIIIHRNFKLTTFK